MLTRTIALALLLATSATQALAQPVTPPAPAAAPGETLAENPGTAKLRKDARPSPDETLGYTVQAPPIPA
jgi:hypothetical protein